MVNNNLTWKERFESMYSNDKTVIEVHKECMVEFIEKVEKDAIVKGRLSILQDFDNLCAADACIGFSEEEWKSIKKFFEFNKVISGWDKQANE